MKDQSARDVLFAGASGLVGGLALPELLKRAATEGFRVFALVRRPLALKHPNLQQIQAEFGNADGLAELTAQLRGADARLQVFVSTLGTTLRQAGSASAFAAVDRDLVVTLAQLARAEGATQALVVSSVGAQASSRNLYLRVKGEMEAQIAALGFARVDFLHPGLLLGQRNGPPRPGEGIAQALAPWFNPLLIGPLRQYGAISAGAVATAVVALCGKAGSGVSRIGNRQIQALAA
ncbi:MAG: NAD(P)H-binding protein [Lysobacterales bacterium]